MKKLSAVTVIFAMLLCFAACGKTQTPSAAAPAAAQQTGSETAAAQQTGSEAAAAQHSDSSAKEMIPGVLYQIGLKDGEKPVIRGVRLDGASAGSYGDMPGSGINGMPLSDSDIRFIFETQEWISVTPDTDVTDGLFAYIVEHRDDPEGYTDSFIAALSDDIPKVELSKPEEEGSWGELYISDIYDAGNYDMVFVYGAKPVARIILTIYKDPELQAKTDNELRQMMSEIKAKAEK